MDVLIYKMAPITLPLQNKSFDLFINDKTIIILFDRHKKQFFLQKSIA
jgi:hypothetical protein